MKNWCYLDIPGWQDHQLQFQQFVLAQLGDSDQVYNYVTADAFRQSCCGLATLLESQIGALERLIIFKMTQEKMMSRLGPNFIHLDSGVQNARLNWPVLNPTSVITRIFKVEDQDYKPVRHFPDPPFKTYVDVYNPSTLKEIDSVCFDQPTVFNVFKPHGMFINDNVWPRIMCSFNFHDNAALAKYLEEDPEKS